MTPSRGPVSLATASELGAAAVRGAGVTFAGSIAGRGLAFAAQLAVARALGVEAFGLYTLGFVAAQLGETLGRLGLHLGGVRLVSRHHRDPGPERLRALLAAGVLVPLAGGAACGAALWLLAGPIATGLVGQARAETSIRAFAWSVPVTAAAGVATSLLAGFQSTRLLAWVRNGLQPVVHLAGVLLLGPARSQIGPLVAVWTLSQAVALAAASWLYLRQTPRSRGARTSVAGAAAELIRESWMLLVSGSLQFLMSWLAVVLLGRLGGVAEVGVYRAASQAARLLLLVGSAVGSIYAPLAASLHAAGREADLAALLRSVTRWAAAASVPGAVLLLVAGDSVLQLFGPGYAAGRMALAALALGHLVNNLGSSAGLTLAMTGRQRLEALDLAAVLPVSVLLNLWLAPRLGAGGTGLAVGAGLVLLSGARAWQAARAVGRSPLGRDTAALAAPAAAGALLLAAARPLVEPAWPASLAALGLGAGLPVLVWLATAGRQPEDVAVLRTLLAARRPARTGGGAG